MDRATWLLYPKALVELSNECYFTGALKSLFLITLEPQVRS